MKMTAAGFALLALASTSLSAQTAIQSSNPSVPPVAVPEPASQPTQVVAAIAPASQENVLRAGTEIPMQTREELTTKKKQVRTGQRVQLVVSSDVMQNGVVVIPAGTPGIGEVTEVRNKGMWGKSGYIAVRILSIRIGDRQIRMSGTFDDKGVTGTGGVVAAVAFVPIAGFFTTGTSATIPIGAPVKGFLDEDIVYRPVQVAPKVLEVPTSVPASAPEQPPAPMPAAGTN